jgi:hypothetical protein
MARPVHVPLSRAIDLTRPEPFHSFRSKFCVSKFCRNFNFPCTELVRCIVSAPDARARTVQARRDVIPAPVHHRFPPLGTARRRPPGGGPRLPGLLQGAQPAARVHRWGRSAPPLFLYLTGLITAASTPLFWKSRTYLPNYALYLAFSIISRKHFFSFTRHHIRTPTTN